MPSQRKAAEYQLSDDDWDELASGTNSDEEVDEKPSGDVMRLLKGQLQEPRFKTANLRQLHDLIQLGNVELNPSYQRDVVWPESKMVQLIQSLFLNYYVPPVIFAVSHSDIINDEVRTCIDGKQRCTSIMRFIEGKIPFKSPYTKEKFWYTSFPTFQKGGKPLPPALKRKFDNISIQVVEYDGINMDQQRDIFQRVQLGVALSAAEKLQALAGPWGEWVTELQKKYITGEGTLGDLLPKLDTSRGRPFQILLSYIMIAINEQRIVPTSGNQTTFLNRTDIPEPEFRRRIEMALSILVELATDHYDETFGTVEQRVAPAELWFMLYLVYSRMGSLSKSRLARAISDMRLFVRSHWADIRSNAKVSADFFDFIDKVPRTKQPGETAAAEEYAEDETSERQQRVNKRLRDEEERDGSYMPGNDSGTYRGRDKSAVVDSLRSKKPRKSSPQKRSAPAPEAPASRPVQQQYVESVPAVRPPSIAMDAPMPTFPTQTVRNMHNGSYPQAPQPLSNPNPYYPNPYSSHYNY